MWWQGKRADELAAVVRAELQILAANMSSAVRDIHEQLLRIDKQMAALAATAGFRWVEGWMPADATTPAQEGTPAPLRPLAGKPGGSGFTGHYL
jgi:hypothetical protein